MSVCGGSKKVLTPPGGDRRSPTFKKRVDAVMAQAGPHLREWGSTTVTETAEGPQFTFAMSKTNFHLVFRTPGLGPTDDCTWGCQVRRVSPGVLTRRLRVSCGEKIFSRGVIAKENCPTMAKSPLWTHYTILTTILRHPRSFCNDIGWGLPWSRPTWPRASVLLIF